jgi:hypothetical protein
MTKKSESYENNPFTIGLNGLTRTFNKARQVAIFAIILAVFSLLTNMVSTVIDLSAGMNEAQQATVQEQQQAQQEAVAAFFSQDIGALAVAGVLIASFVFFIVALSLWVYGAFEYTGAKLAEDKKVTLTESLKHSWEDLASYIWMYIIIVTKVLLWSLLFIVPGIIMAVRYSLAGTVFFAEGKRGNAAVKRSLELTKGAWLTTFGSMTLWNVMTLGTITYLLQPGINAALYSQYKQATDSEKAHPKAHLLSWLTLGIIISLFVVYLYLLLAAVAIELAATVR